MLALYDARIDRRNPKAGKSAGKLSVVYETSSVVREKPAARLPGLRGCVSLPGVTAIKKKIVVDERGKPQAVIIP